MTTKWSREETRMSGFEENTNTAQNQRFSRPGVGHSYPQHYPHLMERRNGPLGAPLSIRAVAELIGCSPWTVRQKYIPNGLPHLRSGPSGKLIFYSNQVVDWVLEQQQKGGTR